MLSSPSTSGKTYEDPCPIQTRRDKRIESESSVSLRLLDGHGLRLTMCWDSVAMSKTTSSPSLFSLWIKDWLGEDEFMLDMS